MHAHWIRRTILFLSGQTITQFGSTLVQFAISWHITLTTQSGGMMTLATLCGFLPQVLISLFSGVWADRYNRKHLILMADGMIALSTALLAILFMLGYQRIWLLFLISAIRSIGSGIQSPAVNALLPDLVPQEQLMRVNGLNASIMSIMMLLSPAAAGALYGWLGLGLVFWVDVLTAAIGMSLLLMLKIERREVSAEEQEPFFANMLSGIRYVLSTKWLRQFLAFFLVYSLMFGPVVFLTPLMVARSFGPEAWRLVVHEMVFSGGTLLGGLIIGAWGGWRNRMHTLIAASAFFGLTTLIMGLSPNFWFYLGIMLPMGVSMPFFNTTAVTILQTKVDPAVMGRVFGLVSIIGSGAMPLSMVVFGPLADVMRVETQLIITGVLMTVIALYMLRLKEVVRAGEPEPPALESAEQEAIPLHVE